MQRDDVLAAPLTPEQLHASVRQHVHALRARQGFAPRDMAQFLQDAHPGAVRRMVSGAQLPLQGMLVLPGTGGKPHFVCDPPDWHTMQFDDEEYVWDLNRMNHWPDLLAAFALTGDRKYAEKVVRELENWIDTCPRPALDASTPKHQSPFGAQRTPWRSLEVGIRWFETWPWVVEFLIDEPDLLTPSLLAKMVVSAHEHGEVLAEACPVFWPRADHNHYLMENLGLLSLACLFPQLAKADAWKQHAVHELERCAQAQLMPAGGQIEGCPSYHNGCTYWFLLAAEIGGKNDLSFSDEYHALVRKSLEYTIHAFRPSGTVVPWGDSDPEQRSMIRAALHGYLAYGDVQYLQKAAGILGVEAAIDRCLDFAWGVGDVDTLIRRLRDEAVTPWPTVAWFRELKQVAMRTGWNREALSVFFACRTPINNGHAHMDPMSFDFCGLGRTLVADPGRFTYRADSDRLRFKSPEYHSTLTIDRKPPFEYVNRWRYGPQKEGTICDVHGEPGLLVAEALHQNYEPAVHRRLIAIVDDAFLLVLDRVTGMNPDSTVQIYYHLNSTDVTWDLASGCAAFAVDDVGMVVAVTENLRGRLCEGEISERMDVAYPSMRLCLDDETTGQGDRSYAAVLIPHKAGAAPALSGLRVQTIGESATCTFSLNGRPVGFIWDENRFERQG